MNLALASPLLAQPIALCGGVALALMIFRVGRNRFRWPLFLDAVAIGAVMGALIGHLEAPFDLRHNPAGFSPATIAFVFAGWPEETVKLIGMVAYLQRHYLVRGRRDVTLAAASLALGFATLENMIYISNAVADWERLALLRAVTAAPLHVFLGIIAGYAVSFAVGLSKPARVTLYVAVALGLGAVHGAYDFGTLAMTSGQALPAALVRFAAAAGFGVPSLLQAIMACAETVAALGAFAALAALDRSEPTPAPSSGPTPTRGFWRRVALSRAFGMGLGGLMMAAAALLLAGAVVAAYVLDEAGPAWSVATVSLLPFALGLMLAAFQGGAPALSRPWRHRLRWGAAALALACLVAAVLWGGPPIRGLIVARIETKAMREAQQSDFLGAIRDYDRALVWQKGLIWLQDTAAILANRASIFALLERYDEARADLDRALTIAPGDAALWVQRSDLRRQRHETAGAVEDIAKAVAVRPDQPKLIALDARALLENGDIVQSRAELARALSLAPNDATTVEVAAAVAVYDGDYDAALRYLNQSLHDRPSDTTSGFARGRVWFYKGDWRRAIGDFTVAENGTQLLYPALWRFLAGRRLGGRRLGGERAAPLEERLKTSGDAWPAPVARLFLGQIKIEDMRAAAKDADQRCEADFYASQMLWEAGDIEQSRTALHTALAECPSDFIEFEGARAALRIIDR